jgi:hypothetical protein
MNKNFTTNDLIRFAYNDCNLQEKLAISQALEDDNELRIEFEAIQEVQTDLDHDLQKPDPSSIRIILDHSRKANRNRNRPLEHSC